MRVNGLAHAQTSFILPNTAKNSSLGDPGLSTARFVTRCTSGQERWRHAGFGSPRGCRDTPRAAWKNSDLLPLGPRVFLMFLLRFYDQCCLHPEEEQSVLLEIPLLPSSFQSRIPNQNACFHTDVKCGLTNTYALPF